MPAAAWMTLVVAALIIAFTAVGLLRVIFHLRHVRQTLAAINGGVHVVAQRTGHRAGGAPVGEREPQAGPRLLRDGLRPP